MSKDMLEELILIDGIIDSNTKYRKIVQSAIAKWVEDYKSGKIQLNTVNDLRTLVQMDAELQKALLLGNKMKLNRRRKKSESVNS